jgi:DNA processing protein
MSAPAEAERIARAALTWAAEPGDPAMGALLRICSPAEIVAALTEGRMPRAATGSAGRAVPEAGEPDRSMPAGGREPAGTEGPAGSGMLRDGSGVLRDGNSVLWEGGAGPATIPRLEGALRRWSARLGEVPPEPELAAWWRDGIRLVIPGDTEWPSQLDVLGQARP